MSVDTVAVQVSGRSQRNGVQWRVHHMGCCTATQQLALRLHLLEHGIKCFDNGCLCYTVWDGGFFSDVLEELLPPSAW